MSEIENLVARVSMFNPLMLHSAGEEKSCMR